MRIRHRLPLTYFTLALVALVCGLIILSYTSDIGEIPQRMAATDTARIRASTESAYYFQSVISNIRELMLEIKTGRDTEVDLASQVIFKDLSETRDRIDELERIINKSPEKDGPEYARASEAEDLSDIRELFDDLTNFRTIMLILHDMLESGPINVADGYFEETVEPNSRRIQSKIWTLVKSHEFLLSEHLASTTAAVEETRTITMLSAIAGFLVALFLSYAISNSIIRPLKKLEESITIIGAGDLDHHIDVNSEDEIGELANAFQTMTNDLRQSTTSVERLNEEVTKRKHNEHKVQEALKEKELLLKEIHHRVKNNMQVITSLLRLQCQGLSDKTVLNMCKESQNRVKAMALIHEQLYQSTELSRINFKDYIGQLTRRLKQSFGEVANRFAIELEIEKIELGIDCAVPCGLLVNELVSNCFKHAFNEGQSGSVTVRMERNDSKQEYILRVSDNGKGIPPSDRTESKGSLGMELIHTLTSQLLGNIQFENKGGAVITVTFPYAVNKTGEERLWPNQESSSSKMKALSH